MFKSDKNTYKKIIRKYRKKLIKDSKQAQPFDWSYLFNSVRTYIEYMYEYYQLGYNVWQVEESRKAILDSLQKCMNIYAELDHLYDNLPDIKMNISDNIIEFIETDEERENNSKIIDSLMDKEQELYKDLFNIIRDNIQSWWD